MLRQLSIRDFVIIEQLQLELSNGLTVLTGETGAGKSIMFDALALATGARADKAMVRQGAKRAEVVALFEPSLSPALKELIAEQALDLDEGLMLRRVVGADGRSRAYLNGTPVPVSILAQVGRLLVEIHGQHEHQTLTGKSQQLKLLDSFASHPELVGQVSLAFESWQNIQRQLDLLRSETALSPAEVELLTFQRDELSTLADDAQQLQQMHREHSRLANAEQILQATQNAIELTDSEASYHASGLLAQARREIDALSKLDDGLAESKDMLEAALIQAQEAARALMQYRDRVELDADQLAELELRLGAIHDAARKHRIEAEDLPQKLHELETRLQQAGDSEQREQQLLSEVAQQQSRYQELAQQLSVSRIDAASRLSDQITDTMQRLGMVGGVFEVSIEFDQQRPARPNGMDEVIFLVSANPGQSPQPLSKVASGGELSRISLAIKVALTAVDGPDCLIFDEVDSGVGGAIAQIVGEKLRSVADDRQVFCITHLPQVAACGHHHLRVIKQSDADNTITMVERLDSAERTQEVARMLGGVEITAKTKAHAAELIKESNR